MEATGASVDDVLDNLMGDDTVDDSVQNQESKQQSTPVDTMGGPTPVKTPLASRPTNRVTPGSGSGLTMYERSMIQKNERERKMKALQEKIKDLQQMESKLKHVAQTCQGNCKEMLEI